MMLDDWTQRAAAAVINDESPNTAEPLTRTWQTVDLTNILNKLASPEVSGLSTH